MKTMITRLSMLCAAAMLLAGCAAISSRDRMAERLAEYEAAAGAPVESFQFHQFWSWEALGNSAVAVYTRTNEAWLLDLRGPCNELPFAGTIGLTSSINRVYARFDSVRVGGDPMPCRIETIRPVDVKKLKSLAAERRAIRAAARDEGG